MTALPEPEVAGLIPSVLTPRTPSAVETSTGPGKITSAFPEASGANITVPATASPPGQSTYTLPVTTSVSLASIRQGAPGGSQTWKPAGTPEP